MERQDKAYELTTGLNQSNQTTSGVVDNKKSLSTKPVEVKSTMMKPKNPSIITYGDPDSPITEEYRKLKTLLLRMTKQEFQNTVMVTSAISGEGKSVTSSNLAVMLAREYGQTVLLIDADLRRPSLGEYLGMAPHVGLADCLENGIDAGRAIEKTGIQNLSFMSAGGKAENPSELLSSQRMKELLSELKHRYQDRYIIIDTAPILLFAETQALSMLVDGVLVVVKEGGVSLKGITEMLDILKGANVLGIVYNNASPTNLEGRYHHHYHHYYSDKRNGKKIGKS